MMQVGVIDMAFQRHRVLSRVLGYTGTPITHSHIAIAQGNDAFHHHTSKVHKWLI